MIYGDNYYLRSRSEMRQGKSFTKDDLLSADLLIRCIHLFQGVITRGRCPYLFTASQTTRPLRIGTTWVKLKPESTTNTHSGAGDPGCAKRGPYGMSDAASGESSPKALVEVKLGV